MGASSVATTFPILPTVRMEWSWAYVHVLEVDLDPNKAVVDLFCVSYEFRRLPAEPIRVGVYVVDLTDATFQLFSKRVAPARGP